MEDFGLGSLFVTVRLVTVTLISLSHCDMVLVDLSQDLPAEQLWFPLSSFSEVNSQSV